MFLLYNIVILLLAPLWVPWMIIRARKRDEAPNWKQRQGDYSDVHIPKDTPSIWVHAVSVGEVMAALPILRQTKALLPGHHIVLSVTTSSGHRTAREHAVDVVDSIVYFPIDIPRFQLAAMMRVRPDVVAIMETELWFNFLWAAKALGAKTLLINGRISDRSFPRSKKIAFFYRALLAQLDRCLMQTEVDATRLTALGARNAEVFGNSKFDQAVDGLDADPAWWRKSLGLPDGLPVIIIGSTRGEDEESFIEFAIDLLVEDLERSETYAVVWAPRHIERADALEKLMVGLFGSCARRSRSERGQFVLLDTYGELSKVYSIADVVVIGGGFHDFGGQNLLQPMAHGKPVIHGQYMQNFKDVTRVALELGASVECWSPQDLALALKDLLDHPDKSRQMGDAGKAFVEANAGASRRYALAIEEAAHSD